MPPRKPTTKTRPKAEPKDKVLHSILYRGHVYEPGSDVPAEIPAEEVERWKRLGCIGKAK